MYFPQLLVQKRMLHFVRFKNRSNFDYHVDGNVVSYVDLLSAKSNNVNTSSQHHGFSLEGTSPSLRYSGEGERPIETQKKRQSSILYEIIDEGRRYLQPFAQTHYLMRCKI